MTASFPLHHYSIVQVGIKLSPSYYIQRYYAYTMSQSLLISYSWRPRLTNVSSSSEHYSCNTETALKIKYINSVSHMIQPGIRSIIYFQAQSDISYLYPHRRSSICTRTEFSQLIFLNFYVQISPDLYQNRAGYASALLHLSIRYKSPFIQP